MKHICSLILFISFFCSSLYSQDSIKNNQPISINPFIDLDITDVTFIDNLSYVDYANYLKNYRNRFLDKSNKFDYSQLFYQILGTRGSFLGNYVETLYYMDSASGISNSDQIKKISNIFTNSALNLETFDSFEKNINDTLRAIFINEAHEIPKHRILSTLLLKPLYEKGFRYLFVEGLGTEDTILNNRKFPVITSGYYIREPLYADLIRQALKIGFKVLPFDYISQNMTNIGRNTRDSMMEINISKIYENDPKAKILVHAGWAHIQESLVISNRMASYYKEITGINPLTIDQTSVIDVTPLDTNISVKDYYMQKSEINLYPSLEREVYDLQTINKPTLMTGHRPTWMRMNGYRNALPLNGEIYKKIQDKSLVQAFLKEEYLKNKTSCIPIDQIYIETRNNDYILYLPEGEFIIRILDEFSNIKGIFDIINMSKEK